MTLRPMEKKIQREAKMAVCTVCGWYDDTIVKHECWPLAGRAVDALIERTGAGAIATKLGYGAHCFAIVSLDEWKGGHITTVFSCDKNALNTGFSIQHIYAYGLDAGVTEDLITSLNVVGEHARRSR